MASMNRVTLVGNLGQAPEMRYTQNQIPVCNFSLATTETRTDAQGNKQDQTEWHRVIVWNKQAENVNKYLTKGSSVLVEGKITYRKWQDKNGQDRYTTDIVAQRVLFLGKSQGQGQAAGQYGEPAQQYGAPQQQPMAADPFASPQANQMGAPSFPQNTPSPAPQAPGGVSLDDIPF